MAPSATGASEGQDLFVTIPLEPIQHAIMHTEHAESPLDYVMIAELMCILVSGWEGHWSARKLRKRWRCGAARANRIAKTCAYRFRTTSGPLADRCRTALTQLFPASSETPVPVADQSRTSPVPTRARSFLERSERESDQDHSRGDASAPTLFDGDTQQPEPDAPKLAPKKPKSIPAADWRLAMDGILVLRRVRQDNHGEVLGRRALPGWMSDPGAGTYTALCKRVARLVREIRREMKADPVDPLEALEALAVWVYRSPTANFWRTQGEPLDAVLGGSGDKVGRRIGNVREALAFKRDPNSVIPLHPPGRRGTTSTMQALLGNMDDDRQPERIVIDPQGG